MGDAPTGVTTTFFTDNDDVSSGSEQLYGDGTAIENITDLSYTVVSYATGEIEVTNNTGATYTITIDYTFTYNTFSTLQDVTMVVPTSTAVEGLGGGNMDVWGTSRDNVLTSLITGPSFTDNSAFELPAAVFSSDFAQTLAQAEQILDPTPAGGTQGSSTNNEDLDTFTDGTLDRQTKLQTLVVGRDFDSSQVGYTMPEGIYGVDFSQTVAEAEKELVLTPAGAEEGENVAASVTFSGTVQIAKEIDDLPDTDTLEIGGTTITIEGADGFQDDVTTLADQGEYEVSLPKKDETDSYTITAVNTYFGEKEETITIDPNAVTVEHDVYYEVPTEKGVYVGEASRFMGRMQG